MIDIKQLQSGTLLLVKTDDWFPAPDGQQYMAVWGVCRIHRDEAVLGFKGKGSANWILQVGDDEGAVFIMGCRIHYAIVCSSEPVGTNIYKPRTEAKS